MGHKPRVRPGLSSPDQSQDVEFTLDQQADEGQHEREEQEGGGPLGPAKAKPDRQQRDRNEAHETPDRRKG
ncbi:hypothetical protein LZ012_11490 [Dechloromonas sp. XY25]|uniref:Uncharacterized protein n=1 Tax=Dechloromonas hankyongensis TaxID=2908002 RepID=A0ABS9K397_9RHOO|nr:hypothetical protein [Dechloromonas hankyongensis]MCG2577616.1 hypothetical protein [Dechloromonas hankyongensis]